MNDYIFNKSVSGEEIKAFRHRHKMSKDELSKILNISPRTIERWESENKQVDGPVVFVMKVIDDNKMLLDKYQLPKRELPLRLIYRDPNNINTVIDVDTRNRIVKFKNYSNDPIKRAFGVRDEIAYEDFERFLESRCFPKTRDKMKIQLELLGLPFYDPFMIIEKTKGRMADDNFELEIVR